MNDITIEPNFSDKEYLGWLKIYINAQIHSPSTQTIYVYRNSEIYAILHTDITGATKSICLPAKKHCGTEYRCIAEGGVESKITVYPFIVNIHYIDKTKEEV